MRHWLVYKFPFVDALGNEFLGGVAIDITERRQMEEALREARDELEERVAERTADLTKTNDRLRQEVLDRRKVEAALLTEQVSLQQMLLSHETDRKLIAYEIHDGPVQYVTAALMHLESALSAHGGRQGSLGKAMETPLRLLRETIQESRRMINGLQPMILDESGVVPAIQYLIEANPGAQKVEFEHKTETERYLPLLEGALFRIAQEALNNARKYSQAKLVRISLREERGWVRLEIVDDGIGFNLKETPNRTVGLNGIRERARLLHGHAIIDSAPGRGTRISVEMPLREP
jgi:signal transduction histidine kinase